MRPKADGRPVLSGTIAPEDRAGPDHIASVRRGPATVARLWSRYADTGSEDTTSWVAAELPDWRTAVLEHRRTTTPDLNPSGSDTQGAGAPSPDEAAPRDEVQVRMRSPDDDRFLARARALLVGDVEAWTLDLPEGRVWDLSVPVRRRFTTLAIAEAGQATPWRIEACRRPSGWALTGPPDLGPGATVFCLWLTHLLDVAYVLRDRPWWAPSEWAVVADDTGRLRPGGFHPDPGIPRSHAGGGGGGGDF